MIIAAFFCLAIGIYPKMAYSMLPFKTVFNPYDMSHVLAQTQLLFFCMLAFVWLNLKGFYPPEIRAVNVDAEWFYRKFLQRTCALRFSLVMADRLEIQGHCTRPHQWTHCLLAQLNYPGGRVSDQTDGQHGDVGCSSACCISLAIAELSDHH